MKDLRIVFMGTPAFSVPILESLINNYNVVMVVCQPDRMKDKKGTPIYPPCKNMALEHHIEVYQPLKVREEYQQILDKHPDIIITAAYGQIIPEEILNYPKYGCINVHASLLPRLRGGAPIHHAIINGDKETGITIMYMDKHMDSGDIIVQKSIPIGENMLLDELYDSLSLLGRDLLIETIPSIVKGTNNRTSQDESQVTFGFNITKEEEKIDFTKTCEEVHNRIRGLSSIPGGYAYLLGKRIKLYMSEKTQIASKKDPGTIEDINSDGIFVSTSDYLIKITDVKMEGKNRCQVKAFLNGIKKEDYIGVKFE